MFYLSPVHKRGRVGIREKPLAVVAAPVFAVLVRVAGGVHKRLTRTVGRFPRDLRRRHGARTCH